VTTERAAARLAVLCGLLGLAVTAPAPAAQAKAPAKPPARPAASPAAGQFDATVAAATAARKAEQWEDAIRLYGKALKVRPDWAEGYWYQGTAYYSLDEFEECRAAFRKVTRLSPKNGSAVAFLGLCEFGLKNYDRALQHLMESRMLGVADKDLGGVARYHAAILMTRIEQYEQALQTLGEFGAEGNDNPRVIEAMGIATLRMAMLPTEVPPDRREMVLMAGRGSYLMATRQTAATETAFQALVERYPETPNVHYAYGVYLLIEQPQKAIEQFKRELEIQPDNSAALMQIAYEYLKESNPKDALPWARKSLEAAPNSYAAHKALGDALLESGDLEGAIRELETSAKLAPDSPSTHLSLAKAYQRAGKAEAAAREREEFVRLDRLLRTNRSGAQAVGGVAPDYSPDSSAPQP
jgi:tetratricopeptide (TPR) repeat protein